MSQKESGQDILNKMTNKSQWGFRKVGKRKGTIGYLNKLERKAQPYEFGYGTIWATSLRSAKIKLKKEINKLHKRKK